MSSPAPAELKRLLRDACDDTFNCISIDGDTSTNDTVLLLASGRSGVHLKSRSRRKKFSTALRQVCQSLAEQIVSDGEGVQHVIRLSVEQAKNSRGGAPGGPDRGSLAVGEDRMGRRRSELGTHSRRSGKIRDCHRSRRVSIMIGDQVVCRSGVACAFDEKRAHQALAKPVCEIRIRLGRGRSSCVFLTTDLTAEYVRINADYST